MSADGVSWKQSSEKGIFMAIGYRRITETAFQTWKSKNTDLLSNSIWNGILLHEKFQLKNC